MGNAIATALPTAFDEAFDYVDDLSSASAAPVVSDFVRLVQKAQGELNEESTAAFVAKLLHSPDVATHDRVAVVSVCEFDDNAPISWTLEAVKALVLHGGFEVTL